MFNSNKDSKLEKEPGWILRYGTIFIFVMLILILLFASFFPFNEVVEGNVMVTSDNPPAHIKAKNTGKILAINYKAGDTVIKGDILGELENNGNREDILYLKNQLKSYLDEIYSLEVLSKTFSPQLHLGSDIQLYYNTFWNNYQQLILDESLQDFNIYDEQIKAELFNQKNSIQNKKEELITMERNLDVSQNNYSRYKQLFQKGVISQLDLETTEKELLSVQRQFYLLKQEFNQLKLENSGFQNKQKLTIHSSVRNKNKLEMDLELSRQNLLNSITEWEDKYLLKSPIEGRLSFFEVWGEYQNITEGENIFTVVPLIQQNLIGKCEVPLRNSGKLKAGQKVNLKLENYPYREWGMVRAKVRSISEVPKIGENPAYIVYLDIGNLRTSYGKNLQFHQELKGTAEILLNEVTLMDRVFFQVRHLWSNQEF
ncbi:HlyD family secretion protein [Gillisia hiemivivida]|uniref:HlyD family efflux transporter periplasmic adaptor subunit n=1 Tax=Gillisia hiemivivida TaxID=291190 RepID=A0A5C6ZWJ2_9FLAO|nr:HlyD family efflux transporter periplasmic adaptor subunit [Gillisia hiemivivida]TXD95088.1 HlyD family efflux transporter periplasmic adaptor subunit [Gillisia hiemivivida]